MKLINRFITWLGDMIECLFEKHKFVRRALVCWAVWLITYVVVRVMEPSILLQLTTPAATVITCVIGLLATVTGLYIKSREQDAKNSCIENTEK